MVDCNGRNVDLGAVDTERYIVLKNVPLKFGNL